MTRLRSPFRVTNLPSIPSKHPPRTRTRCPTRKNGKIAHGMFCASTVCISSICLSGIGMPGRPVPTKPTTPGVCKTRTQLSGVASFVQTCSRETGTSAQFFSCRSSGARAKKVGGRWSLLSVEQCGGGLFVAGTSVKGVPLSFPRRTHYRCVRRSEVIQSSCGHSFALSVTDSYATFCMLHSITRPTWPNTLSLQSPIEHFGNRESPPVQNGSEQPHISLFREIPWPCGLSPRRVECAPTTNTTPSSSAPRTAASFARPEGWRIENEKVEFGTQFRHALAETLGNRHQAWISIHARRKHPQVGARSKFQELADRSHLADCFGKSTAIDCAEVAVEPRRT